MSETAAGTRARAYKFGPLEHTGILANLSGRQLVLAIITGVIAMSALFTLGPFAGMLVALVVCGLGFFAATKLIAGRPAVEWTDTALRHAGARVSGSAEYESDGPALGHIQAFGSDEAPEAPIALPPALDGIEVLGYPYRGTEAGILYDAKISSYTATVQVTPSAFVLLAQSEQEAKLRDWEDILAMFAQETSPISSIQWLERTLPARPDELVDYLNEKRDVSIPEDAPAVKSYLTLLREAEHVQQQHQLFLTLRLDAKRPIARKLAGKINKGKGHEGFCEVLMREVTALVAALKRAQLEVDGVVRPRTLAQIVRLSYDPFAVDASSGPDGVDPANMGPMVTRRRWDTYEADGAMHVTYWIAEWPKIPVGPAFLMPLLLASGLTRSIAMTMTPVDAAHAARSVEQAATMHDAEADVRTRRQFRLTAAFRREGMAIAEREEELASGFAEMRFAGFVTVSGRSEEELDAACAQVEHAALQSRLRLRRMSGEHHVALTYTMPLARGLRV